MRARCFACALWILIPLVAFVVLGVYYFDIAIARDVFFVPDSLYTAAKAISDIFTPEREYLFWPIIYLFARSCTKNRTLRLILITIVFSLPTANLIAEILKWLLGRSRPEFLFEQGIYGFFYFQTSEPYHSFPSGHAATIGAICGAVAAAFPRSRFPLLILAMLLSMCRVILEMHFFTDIITGAVIGFITSLVIFGVFAQLNHRVRREKN